MHGAGIKPALAPPTSVIRMSAHRRASVLILSIGLLWFSASANAESHSRVDPVGPDGERRVTLTQRVEPSFHIEPIVHRFEARRGAVIPFKFEIKSTGKAMNVTVLPVQLRQELTGIILHDLNGEAPTEMRFSSPTEFKLAEGETHYIQGELTVPLAKSNFLSYGVLVRDNGGDPASRNDSSDPARVSAGIRFVTQYVLRVDVETGVKDLSQMGHLVFEQGHVVNEKGMPVARTFLVNPTDFAFECSVRGTIESSSTSRPQPFHMVLPSRENLGGEQRHLVRIMPRSRVVLNAPVDSLLFPGEQSLTVEVTNGRRALVDQSFSINVGQGTFPALETQLAYLDNELSVQPAQIEVGSITGSKRTCNLRFTNNSIDTKSVRMELRDLTDNPLSGLVLSSDNFEVKPGRTKTVRASLQSSSEIDQAKFGTIQVWVNNGRGQQNTQSLPVALLFGEPPIPSIQVGELQSVEKNGHTSFRLAVTNSGEGYVPVHADLQVADGVGHALELADGFGRWLRPGETRELVFMPERTLVTGDYKISLNSTNDG